MIDPYATEAKLLAISSPCGAPLHDDPRFLRRIEQARKSLRNGRGVRIEDLTPPPLSEAIRRIEELAQLLARECGSLREVLAAVRETEGGK